jgi:alkanesulfonate monooxygenase SsuD/methylene tetrahydromethanopterin reductase-like flavin-dependent oxidoreductase (luciferase family)
MRFGIFSNGQRNNSVAAITYAEDLYEVVLADKLGFEEAWISEHIGLHRIDLKLFTAEVAPRLAALDPDTHSADAP